MHNMASQTEANGPEDSKAIATTPESSTLAATPPTPTDASTSSADFLRTKRDNIPKLGQIGRQAPVNFRLSHLSDSGGESCDADEQTQLIRSTSYRSHKFIIIPANSVPSAAAAPSKSLRQVTSSSSLASLAAAIQHQQQQRIAANQQAAHQRPELQRQLSTATSEALRAVFKSSSQPSVNFIEASTVTHSGAPLLERLPYVRSQSSRNDASTMTTGDAIIPAVIVTEASPTSVSNIATNSAGVTFTIDGCESDYESDGAAITSLPDKRAERIISSINATISPTLSTIEIPRNATTVPPMTQASQRPRMERNSSMRSFASAYISSSHQPVQPPFHQSHHYLQPVATFSGQELSSASSSLYRNRSANQIYSDVTSVRSLASIALGSTDGRKLVIRRVPNTPDELFSLVHTPSAAPAGNDDDNDSFLDVSDETSNLKPRQQHWGNKMQFVLACVGYSVGLGNVWRFPYMCYKSGGGVFLVPYCIILFICSIPLLYMELSVGQYTGRGPIGALGQLCPLFKGAGLASVVVSFLMSTYYSVIIGYSIYYFFTAFRSDMPWVDCNNRWNTPDCWIPQRTNLSSLAPNTSRTPSEEFFENKVLQISRGIEYPGMMRWELFACLMCAWLMVYFATWKSIKSSAKVRYFTATFPFILIVILMGRAVTLDGAHEGLRYFFRPNWTQLKNANVWINAASQNFNSLGITFGSMISFASYNKYNNNIVYDTIAVSVVNILTSLLVGIFAFATLGNLALEQNSNVGNVIGDGPGLIFVVYPQAMAKMPYAQLWAVMFFFMLLCLGLNSQFAIVEVVVTSVQDGFPGWIKRNLGYHEIVVLIVCVISFGFGIPNLVQSGIYYFQLMDHYAASVSIMFLAFCQMIAIAWFYGTGRLSKNIKQMTGKAPSIYLKSCWLLLGPCLLFAIWVLSLVNYEEPTYHNGRYRYPDWAYGIGWMFASFSLVCIPGYAVIHLLRSTGDTFLERFKNTIRPNIYECRICGEHHCEHEFSEQEQYMLAQEMTSHLLKMNSKIPEFTTNSKSFSRQKAKTYNAMNSQKEEEGEFVNKDEGLPISLPSTSVVKSAT